MFQDLSGRVLDAGVGTGRNVFFYPDDCKIIGIDKSPAMLNRARLEAERLGKTARLMEMDVKRTSFPDGHFDTIVATFLFGILREDEQHAALKELARICKPGGSIRLLDYALSRKLLPRLVMELVKPWSLHVFSQRFDARTEPYIADAGLELRECRYAFADIAKLLVLRPCALPVDTRSEPGASRRLASHPG